MASFALNAVLALCIVGYIAHSSTGSHLGAGIARTTSMSGVRPISMRMPRRSVSVGASKTMRSPVAEEYGTGLATMAIEEKMVEKISADVKAWQEVFKAEPEVREFMFDPLADVGEKQQIVDDVVSKSGMQEYTANFLTLLLEMGRFDSFDEIAEVYEEEIMALQGTKSVTVRSAIKLDDTAMDKIAKKVKEISGVKSIKIQQEIDPELLAGFVIDLEGSVIDMSLKNELSQLKTEMLKPAT